jgi:hypothetical protein
MPTSDANQYLTFNGLQTRLCLEFTKGVALDRWRSIVDFIPKPGIGVPDLAIRTF